MKRYYFVVCVSGLGMALYAARSLQSSPQVLIQPSTQAVTQATLELLFAKLYPDASVNGYNIPKCEIDLITNQGGNPTYGEITQVGVSKLIEMLHPTAQDVFFDLGSGIGKMVIQMYLESPVKKSIGVELSTQRFRLAQDAKDRLMKEGLLDRTRELRFMQNNILNVPLDEATIIFMNSLCFTDHFMEQILKQVKKLNTPLTLVSTKQFPANKYLVLKQQISLPMSWSSQSTVYIYRLEKSSR